MRKAIYRMPEAEALEFLGAADVVRIATTLSDGTPVFRTVHSVLTAEGLAFHGARAGEKLGFLDRTAVACVEETVASIPSYFVDAERACPATTYYRSVQVHGRVVAVTDLEEKAAVVRALLRKHQPEGGHVPVEAKSPLYVRALSSLLVARVTLDRIDGKAKLGQNRTPAELHRVLEAMWARGAPTDPRAIELVRAANPRVPPPAFLRAPHGAVLRCALCPEDVPSVVKLVTAEVWQQGEEPERIAAAHHNATAWVGVRGTDGELIATARAMSDGLTAWIYDVVVAAAWRSRGIGRALMRHLLTHPALRHAKTVRLATRAAERLYEKFGFRTVATSTLRPWSSTEMALVRPEPEAFLSSEPL